jgi:hypothetical protein
MVWAGVKNSNRISKVFIAAIIKYKKYNAE